MKTKFRYRNKLDEIWSFACVHVPKELMLFQVENHLREHLQKLGIRAKYIEIEKN